MTSHLADRQFSIAWQVYRGRSDREIARALGISWHTVRNMLTRIYRKLNMRGRTDLAVWIYREWVKA